MVTILCPPQCVKQQFLAATKQLYDWFSPSLYLSVHPIKENNCEKMTTT